MKIEIEVPEAHILNALQSVQGYPYYSGWVSAMEVEEATALADLGKANAPKQCGGFTLTYDREKDEEGTFGGQNRFTRGDIAKGLAVMATDFPGRFGQLIADEGIHIDAPLADILLQCIVFGKEVYA